MTTYDIKFTDNNIKNTNNGNIYSQILDDIILSTVKKNNSYLFNTKKEDDDLIDAMFDELDHTYIYKPLKGDTLFAKACDILANYGKKKSIMKGIKLGKIYRLENGLPVISTMMRFRLVPIFIVTLILVITTSSLHLVQRLRRQSLILTLSFN